MNFNFAFSEEGEASRKGSSAAVRLALGETQIVAETKQFLEEQGLCLDAFAPKSGSGVEGAKKEPIKRSKTVIVVKNLPANTSPGIITAKEIEFTFTNTTDFFNPISRGD